MSLHSNLRRQGEASYSKLRCDRNELGLRVRRSVALKVTFSASSIWSGILVLWVSVLVTERLHCIRGVNRIGTRGFSGKRDRRTWKCRPDLMIIELTPAESSEVVRGDSLQSKKRATLSSLPRICRYHRQSVRR